jgi:uncharacterized membrane protein YeiB
MLAAVYALLGKKIPFVVTPKGSGGKSSLTYFWPQIVMMLVIFLSVTVGIWKSVQQYSAPLLINMVWSVYCLILLSMVFYFREDVEESSLYYTDMFEEFVRK